jgi:hypothetical protein
VILDDWVLAEGTRVSVFANALKIARFEEKQVDSSSIASASSPSKNFPKRKNKDQPDFGETEPAPKARVA